VLGWAIVAFYGGFALVGFLNLTLMRRPGRLFGSKPPLVLIPARNEEQNLSELLPLLVSQVGSSGILVFDDESEDGTAKVARNLGVSVVSPREPLPLGWTGKNRACYELARSAQERDADWWLFLDADVRPEPEFIAAINSLCAQALPSVGMITGFPTIVPGRGVEPLFLAWVGWILLTTNPYGLVSRSGIGHSRFKNGQMHCWRREVYWRLQPNERVKGQIMEDVMIGRLLAKENVAVEVANLSSVIKVRMYDRWQETLDGMSKNSYEIAGNLPGALGIAAFMLFAGWGWLLAGPLKLPALGLLLLSGVFVCAIARAAWWPMLFAPIIPTIGAFTMVRSAVWHRRGTVKWKGRVYDENTLTHSKPKKP
jgi:hypothetical protein